jgi:CubicO group peptidase (beta-lactamase class C family)
MASPTTQLPLWLALGFVAVAPVRAQAPEREAPRLAPSEALPRGELEAFLDGWLVRAMAREHVAGAVVAVVQNGEPVLEKGYGFANLGRGRRVDPATTLFRIGSITKTFTWILLMRRVEAGRIGLDDPINEHLPPELQIPDEGFERPIRVRDLMTHSPGFEDRVFGTLFVRDPADLRPLAQYLAEDRVARVREPGKLSSYSNYGVGLAGAMLEQLDGQPWQDLLEAEILKPLGLDQTTGREPYPARDELPAPMPARLAEDSARGYRWNGVAFEPRPFEYITHVAPAGAISSTGADMADYMLLLLNDGTLRGTEIFGREAAAAFRTPFTSLPAAVGSWDAGFLEGPLPGGFRGIGHNGATLLFFSNLVLVPELDLGIFVSTNSAGGGAIIGALPADVIAHFYAPKPPAPPKATDSLREAARDYVGSYLVTRRPYHGLEGFLIRFQSLVRIGVAPDGALVASLQGQPIKLEPTETPRVFSGVDLPVRLVFEPPEGRAERVLTLGFGMERASLLDTLPALLVPGALTVVIALTVLGSLAIRRAWPPGQSKHELAVSQVRAGAALLWLVAFAALIWLGARAVRNPETVIYTWPTPSIVLSSACALGASVLTVACLMMLPRAWRSGSSDVPQWTLWRRIRMTSSVLVFAALALILARWGALQPWNP